MIKQYMKEHGYPKLKKAKNSEIFQALMEMTNEMLQQKKMQQKKLQQEKNGEDQKKIYYISSEFLMGKLLGNNLINLGIYEQISKELMKEGISLAFIEEWEAEPSLGNGGLGRLAACFLDSGATLGLPLDGIGLNYHCGLFRQVFRNHKQKEKPDDWMKNNGFLKKNKKSYTVEFGGFHVRSICYELEVSGYHNRINTLHLFDLPEVERKIIRRGIRFNKKKIKKNLTLFLYPDDSDEEGRLLRVYQEYFMVSNAAQMILEEAKKKGCNYHDLDAYARIQINDTHPSMIIPELIRLLGKKGVGFEEAVEIVTKVCAYTNHTILAEALECWPMSYLEKVAPSLVPIIKKLDRKIKKKYSLPKVDIIDENQCVHMAHMDIHYSHSTNGVAKLHTEILKETELHEFYKLYPERFHNETNGITFRRWLLHANWALAKLLIDSIGEEFITRPEKLEDFMQYYEDNETLKDLSSIKMKNKKRLANYLRRTQGKRINPDAIFDVQVKRLHEYKRQQLNALFAIHMYLEIKRGRVLPTPVTLLFGAKAAPAYTIAKDIIHLILCLQELINKDPDVSPYFNVIMMENYNVTLAEKVIPACDISEQISLASKEASGTGNMKFMLNGGITLGTEDGANVEIHQLVGDDNIFIFGEDKDTVIERYQRGDYRSKDYYDKDPMLKEAVDFIVSEKMLKIGKKKNLNRLYRELLDKDWFMTFPDFQEYVAIKNKAYAAYENQREWLKMSLVNIAKAGYFSSDRTIQSYNEEIWRV